MKKRKEQLLIKNKFFLKVTVFFLINSFLITCTKGSKIIISNQITKEVYFLQEIKKGDILSFEWEHSFEHILWKEYYRLNEKNIFDLYAIATEGFGAGIPAEMDCTYRYENGLIYMENIKGSYFKEFNWINSKKQLKKILVNEKEIIKGEDLPEREKINLTIK